MKQTSGLYSSRNPRLTWPRPDWQRLHAAHDVAKARRAAGSATGPDAARLGREEAEANAIVGDAESALGQALTQAVRARRVGEGMAAMRASSARRTAAGGGLATGGTPAFIGGGGSAPAGGPAQGEEAHRLPRDLRQLPRDLRQEWVRAVPHRHRLRPRRSAAAPTSRRTRTSTLDWMPSKPMALTKLTPWSERRRKTCATSNSRKAVDNLADNIKGATVHEGPVPLEGPAAAPARQAPAPPKPGRWIRREPT